MEEVNKAILSIAIIILIIAVICAIISYSHFYKHEHFICPKCGYSWKPPILKMIFAENAVEGKIIKCPKCGSKEYIEPTKDKN